MKDLEKLLSQGKYDEIIELLEGKAYSAEEQIVLGLAYYGKGKRNKAISIFKKTLQKDPNNKDALFNIAESYLQLEKFPKAKDYALQLLKLSPNDWAVHDILSTCYEFEGFYDRALHHLSRAINFAPSDALPDLKMKLEVLKERAERAKLQKKLAIICAKGLDNFIDDIIKGLKDEYWVQRRAVTTDKEIKAAIDWADIVWLEWANEVAIIGTNYPATSRKPTLVRLHSYEIFTDMPLKINWQNVNVVIFVASHIEEILYERYPMLKGILKKTAVVHNGIDLKKTPFKERKPGYDIAWVAHINYKKAPELAIQIIAKLVEIDPNYKLHFAGDFQDPRYEVYLQHIVRALGIETNVIFHGWVDDMEEFWEDVNYLLSTSLHEGHPYNIMEAMARGIKPVIHWFRGAEKLYDKKWLFRVVDEAVEMIITPDYFSEAYRKSVEKYTFKKQLTSIKEIIKTVTE